MNVVTPHITKHAVVAAYTDTPAVSMRWKALSVESLNFMSLQMTLLDVKQNFTVFLSEAAGRPA
jgi:hypothetical protein